MPEPLNSLVPLAHVKSVARSIEFYRKLGFQTGNTFQPEDETEPVWAWLRAGGAHLMIARAGEPVIPSQQAVLFYVYCNDVEGMRAALEAGGLAPGPIRSPFYAPRGEFRVEDPDGYVIMVTHT